MKLTTTEINKLKKAIHEFNYSNAPKRVLMFDESDHTFWVDNFFNANNWKEYHSKSIYVLDEKDNIHISGQLLLDGMVDFIEEECYKLSYYDRAISYYELGCSSMYGGGME